MSRIRYAEPYSDSTDKSDLDEWIEASNTTSAELRDLTQAVSELVNDMSFIRDVPAITRLREVYIAQGNELNPQMQAYITGANKIRHKK